MIKLAFKDRETMEEEVGWLNKSEAFWENVTQFGEVLRVNSVTLEIESANGYENFIGGLLREGKIRILK